MQEGILTVQQIEKSPNGEVVFLTCRLSHGFLDFEEGQFLMLETVDYQVEGKSLKKPYSIASTHNHFLETKEVSFYVKKASENGMSNYLTQIVKVGDVLRFF
jgi:ferredoxin-NADP reductase